MNEPNYKNFYGIAADCLTASVQANAELVAQLDAVKETRDNARAELSAWQDTCVIHTDRQRLNGGCPCCMRAELDAANRKNERAHELLQQADAEIASRSKLQIATDSELDAAKSRLAEIKSGAEADEADLKKMRDGTKLTRFGLVELIIYLRQELDAVKKERDKLQAHSDFLKSKGLTVGLMKTSDKLEPYLVYVIEHDSELCEMRTVNKLIDSNIERDAALARVKELEEALESALCHQMMDNGTITADDTKKLMHAALATGESK